MELIDRLLGDTLWIYTAILGSLFGAAFLAYFKDTRAGLWCYAKFDSVLDFVRDRYGWTWFDQPADAWRKKYPYVTKKIDDLEDRIEELEEMAHPSKDLCEFAGFDDLETRIKELENELAKR